MSEKSWVYETKRLRLRPVDSDDAENLMTLNGDPEVMKYLGPEYKTLEETKKVLPLVVERNDRYDGKLGVLAAHEKESGEFIGWYILRPDKEKADDLQNLEIGYRLRKKHWGKGYATEGSLMLFDVAKEQYQAKRVYGIAMKANEKSIKVLSKVGLRWVKDYQEEILEHEDKPCVLYEWLST